jgi:hypothetical protein
MWVFMEGTVGGVPEVTALYDDFRKASARYIAASNKLGALWGGASAYLKNITRAGDDYALLVPVTETHTCNSQSDSV